MSFFFPKKWEQKGAIIWHLLCAKHYTNTKEMEFPFIFMTSQLAIIHSSYSFVQQILIVTPISSDCNFRNEWMQSSKDATSHLSLSIVKHKGRILAPGEPDTALCATLVLYGFISSVILLSCLSGYCDNGNGFIRSPGLLMDREWLLTWNCFHTVQKPLILYISCAAISKHSILSEIKILVFYCH